MDEKSTRREGYVGSGMVCVIKERFVGMKGLMS